MLRGVIGFMVLEGRMMQRFRAWVHWFRPSSLDSVHLWPTTFEDTGIPENSRQRVLETCDALLQHRCLQLLSGGIPRNEILT